MPQNLRRLVIMAFLVSALFMVSFREIYGQSNSVSVSVGTGIGTTELLSNGTPTRILHAQVEASDNLPAPSGYARLWYIPPNASGGRSEVAIAGKEPRRRGRIYAENSDLTHVGVAFSNPGAQDVMLSFFFTDANGANSAGGVATIPANSQIAAFLGEPPFNAPPSFQGTFTFNASAPVAALAVRGYLNESGLFLMPQIPIGDIDGSVTTVVPYFVNGSGCVIGLFDCRGSIQAIATELILVNPSDDVLSGTFTFLGQGDVNNSAQPSAVTIEGKTSAVFEYAIPPRSARRFATAGRPDPFQQGSIQIATAQNGQGPLAFAILSFQGNGPNIQYQTTIVGQVPATAFQLPVLGFRLGGPFAGFTTSTGIVITNPTAAPVGINLELPSMSASVALTVPASGQIAVTPQTELQLSNGYAGAVRVSSSSKISVVGLQQYINQFYGALAIEALDESVPPPAKLVFPHLATGNYRSSIVLFKTSDNQASTATIRFFNPSGLPADPHDFGLQE